MRITTASSAVLFFTSLLLALLNIDTATGQDAAAQPSSIRVVVKPLEPFVMEQGGDFTGFSIDLWEEAAARLGVSFEYIFVETVTDQLNAVQNGVGDMAMAGITITKAREEMLDFSQPYFRSGLQLMTKVNSTSWTSPHTMLFSLLFSTDFLGIIAGLLVIIIIFGHIFWLAERKNNPEFPRAYFAGVWEGIWYTTVTLVTVGYGDRTARSIPGRILAMMWMFVSLFLIANFTANITSRMTISHFQGAIENVSDLPGKRIATVTGSTAADYLTEAGYPFVGITLIEDAYAMLEQDTVDVIVYDAPVLMYYENGDGLGKVQTVGDVFEPEQYGIAFPHDSALREQVNRVLLGIYEDGTYDRFYERWFTQGQG